MAVNLPPGTASLSWQQHARAATGALAHRAHDRVVGRALGPGRRHRRGTCSSEASRPCTRRTCRVAHQPIWLPWPGESVSVQVQPARGHRRRNADPRQRQGGGAAWPPRDRGESGPRLSHQPGRAARPRAAGRDRAARGGGERTVPAGRGSSGGRLLVTLTPPVVAGRVRWREPRGISMAFRPRPSTWARRARTWTWWWRSRPPDGCSGSPGRPSDRRCSSGACCSWLRSSPWRSRACRTARSGLARGCCSPSGSPRSRSRPPRWWSSGSWRSGGAARSEPGCGRGGSST